jgi:hypothetical protein
MLMTSDDIDSSRKDLLSLKHAERLLTNFSHSSAIGFGICDRQWRYRCINHALAASNGIPPEAHLGNTMHEVLGAAAEVIELAFRQVLSTGEVTSRKIDGTLPFRKGTISWIASYFPVKNPSSRVQLMGVVAVEVTDLRRLDGCLSRLTSDLVRAQKSDFNSDASELRQSLKEYYANLNMYLSALTQNVWSLEKDAAGQLAPVITTLDRRIIGVRTLVSSVANRLGFDGTHS